MKFAIILFLGLCAISANAEYWGPGPRDSPTIEPQNAVVDKIKEGIEAVLKKTTESFEFMNNKMKALLRKMNDEAGNLVMKAKEKANVVKNEIQGKLNEMKEKGGAIAACAKELEPEYVQVEKDLMTDVKKCAGNVFVAGEEMKKDISDGMAALSKAMSNLRDVVSDCLGWNPIAVAKCIKEKTDEFKKISSELMNSISAAYKAAQAKAGEIMTQGKQCNNKALEKAKARIGDLNERMSKCYKSEDEFFYY